MLPAQVQGVYRAFVTTNADLPPVQQRGLVSESATFIYESQAGGLNNVLGDSDTLAVTLRPRPDLQVADAIVPDHVPAGGTASLRFTIVNQGTVPTTTPRWTDRVYLSIDNEIGPDDVLLGAYQNGAALAPGEQYSTDSGLVTIPIRFRGDVFLIVQTDADRGLDEYPGDNNNTRAFAFHVDPKPFADLVTSAVVAPAQAITGSQIEVRYTPSPTRARARPVPTAGTTPSG